MPASDFDLQAGGATSPPRIFYNGRDNSLRVPAEIERRLTRAGGRALNGKPNFRIVWGWTRFDMSGGKWFDGEIGYRQILRYPQPSRWYVEMYRPPEFYGSPEAWEVMTGTRIDGKDILELGPYPSEGGYEHLATLQVNGRFLPLSPTVIENVLQIVARARAYDVDRRERPRYDPQALIDKDEMEFDKFADIVIADSMPVQLGREWISPSFRAKRNSKQH